MRFKITTPNEPSHSSPVTCLGWSSSEEAFSAGDDNQFLQWNVSNNESTKIVKFNELLPTDLHFMPRVSSSLGKHGDLILLTSADGKFHIMNRTGRIERTVDAHQGAILVGQWSNDGASLLTGGEDGCIKIWSRSGMLRSTVVTSDNSIYSASWSPDNQGIAYTQGKFVVIKQLAPNTKPTKWKAHEGLVLCLAWSQISEVIVTGGEDNKYRVWDNQGRQLFSSSLHNNPITAVAWSPNGDLFAVGSYNTLRLCDSLGWSRSLDKPNTGCIYNLAWSNDGTQVAAACANGHVLFAHLIEKQVQYKNFTVTVSEQKSITVQDVSNDTVEYLDLAERAIHLAMQYGHLVVTTPSQCYIYSTTNWNTPAIFDLKDGFVVLLLLCERHMLVVEQNTIGLYNFQGKLIASPRWPNMRLETLRNSFISLTVDTLAVRDVSDSKTVYIIDLNSNRTENLNSVTHTSPIVQLTLNQAGPTSGRMMAVLDKSKDLFVTSVRSSNKTFSKLSSQIQSFQWNAEENMIAAVQDTHLLVWYCPLASFNSDLLKLCSFYYDSPELGRNPKINDFVENSVSIRRADGSLVNVPISPFPAVIHRYVQDNKWDEALRVCRMINEVTTWACLAVMSTQSSNELLEIAEEAYAAINHFDKVLYIQHIKELPTRAEQMAGMAMLGGSVHNAESILLHNGLFYQAILNHIQLHNWNRALELALKHKGHVDTVLYLRNKYLKNFEKEENNEKFLNLKDTVIDEEKIKEKLNEHLKNVTV